MLILAIETSCDETAASLVEDGVNVRSNVIASSRKTFERLGGVIPEDAARKQLEYILPVIHEAMSGVIASHEEIDAIAVTSGPGLLGSLLVGVTAGRSLSALWKKPLIGVHHTMGHLSSTWLRATSYPSTSSGQAELQTNNPKSQVPSPMFPLLTLSVSGGHSDLWLRHSHARGERIGQTRDDAVGEAFDKGASMLGLPYPGGPAIAETAKNGNALAFNFPLPLKKEDTLDFSFSGLKTHLRYIIRELETHTLPLEDLAASYESALCAHLADKVEAALNIHQNIQEVHVVGGVSANSRLRSMLKDAIGNRTLRHPVHLSYCTDNAAMIGAAAYFLWEELGERVFEGFETKASLKLLGY